MEVLISNGGPGAVTSQNYSFNINGTANLISGRTNDYVGMGWVKESFAFFASDTVTTLTFASTCSTCGCFGPAIDCIEVCSS